MKTNSGLHWATGISAIAIVTCAHLRMNPEPRPSSRIPAQDSSHELHERCFSPSTENLSNQSLLVTLPATDTPSRIPGIDPSSEFSRFGFPLALDQLLGGGVAVREVSDPECMRALNAWISTTVARDRAEQRQNGPFSLERSESREYCGRPVPRQSEYCTYAPTLNPQLVGGFAPDENVSQLADQLALFAHPQGGSSNRNLNGLVLFITPDARNTRSPKLTTYERLPTSWVKSEEAPQYLAALGMQPPPLRYRTSPNINQLPNPLSQGILDRALQNRRSFLPDLALLLTEIPHVITANPDGQAAATLTRWIQFTRGLARVWKSDSSQAPINTIEFFENRESELRELLRTGHRPMLQALANSIHSIASPYLAYSTSAEVIIDAAALWWSTRQLQLALACNADGTAVIDPLFANLVDAQYLLQDCRHSYSKQAIIELNAGNNEYRIPFAFESPSWVRMNVLASRRERAKNMVVAHRLLRSQLDAGNLPSQSDLSLLNNELGQVLGELQRGIVVTWLGIKPMTPNDRTAIEEERNSASEYLIAAAQVIVQMSSAPRDSDQSDVQTRANALYPAIQGIWDTHQTRLELQAWNERFESSRPSTTIGILRTTLENYLRRTRESPGSETAFQELLDSLMNAERSFAQTPSEMLSACSETYTWVKKNHHVLPWRQRISPMRMAGYSNSNSCFAMLSRWIASISWLTAPNVFMDETIQATCERQKRALNWENAAITCQLEAILTEIGNGNQGIERWMNLLRTPGIPPRELRNILEGFRFHYRAAIAGRANAQAWQRGLIRMLRHELNLLARLLNVPAAGQVQRCLLPNFRVEARNQQDGAEFMTNNIFRDTCQDFNHAGAVETWAASSIRLFQASNSVTNLQFPDSLHLQPLAAKNRWIDFQRTLQSEIDALPQPGAHNLTLAQASSILARRGRLQEILPILRAHPQAATTPLRWVIEGATYDLENVMGEIESLMTCSNRRGRCL